MPASRGSAALLLVVLFACACASGCSQTGTGLPGRRGGLAYSGPAGWELQVLQQPPPYGLAQFVEPRTPGIPDASRGFLLIGKGQIWAGVDPLANACEEQWHSEMDSDLPPEDRQPYRLEGAAGPKAGRGFTGWEARRRLRDGTVMRLRTVCGVKGTESTYLYLSAPDQSRLYEATWTRLVELNIGP